LSQSLILSNRPFATSQVHDLSSKLRICGDSLKDSFQLKAKTSVPAEPQVVDSEANGEASGKGGAKDKAKAQEFKAKPQDAKIEGVEEVETPLARASRDGLRISSEAKNGITAQILKDRLFNTPLTGSLTPADAVRAAAGIM